MKKSNRPPSLISQNFHYPGTCHVCLIYDDDEQRRKIVSEYLSTGLQQGEVVRYFSDKTPTATVKYWLNDLGIDVEQAERNGSLGIYEAEKAYCPEGHFEPETMINNSLKRYDIAEAAGYKGSRACGEMSWALRDIPGTDRLIEYEVLLNTVDTSFPHSGMCQYDSRLFDGKTLLKVLQVHPYVIANGQIVQNPFFIQPDEFYEQK
ncbi:MAG: MEDS domain-containing protein [Bacteroidales bacterium]|nr:MEDS domain-containing protein [Bacteroidales bacterium]